MPEKFEMFWIEYAYLSIDDFWYSLHCQTPWTMNGTPENVPNIGFASCQKYDGAILRNISADQQECDRTTNMLNDMLAWTLLTFSNAFRYDSPRLKSIYVCSTLLFLKDMGCILKSASCQESNGVIPRNISVDQWECNGSTNLLNDMFAWILLMAENVFTYDFPPRVSLMMFAQLNSRKNGLHFEKYIPKNIWHLAVVKHVLSIQCMQFRQVRHFAEQFQTCRAKIQPKYKVSPW